MVTDSETHPQTGPITIHCAAANARSVIKCLTTAVFFIPSLSLTVISCRQPSLNQFNVYQLLTAGRLTASCPCCSLLIQAQTEFCRLLPRYECWCWDQETKNLKKWSWVILRSRPGLEDRMIHHCFNGFVPYPTNWGCVMGPPSVLVIRTSISGRLVPHWSNWRHLPTMSAPQQVTGQWAAAVSNSPSYRPITAVRLKVARHVRCNSITTCKQLQKLQNWHRWLGDRKEIRPVKYGCWVCGCDNLELCTT